MSNITINEEYCKAIIYKLTTSNSTYVTTGYTFFCMLNGSTTLSINSDTYQLSEKDVLLIQPKTCYNLSSETSALILELSFDYSFFTEAFPNNGQRIYCNSILDLSHDYIKLRTYIAQVALVHFSDLYENRFLLLSNVYHLFHYIKSEFMISEPTAILSKQEMKLKKITDYLRNNYSKPLSLQDLADVMDFTPQYLVTFMKQNLKQTFYEYLNHIRLKAAMEQLEYTKNPISNIAFTCGFPNLSAFQKTFVTYYKMDPELFREQNFNKPLFSDEKQLITEPSLAKDLITNNIRITNYSNSIIEYVEREEVKVIASKSKSFTPTWKELINLGNSTNFGKPSFRTHLMELQSELNFKYGRVQGILELIDVYTSEDTTTYLLIKVFRIIDFLRSIHMYPLIELGNKPYSIYKENLYSDELANKETSSDYNLRILQLLPVLLNNCINRYGFQEVSLWKFELSMEYNTLMTVVEPPSLYVDRFQFIYEMIKSYLPLAKIGGPGFNTFIHLSSLEGIIKEMIRRHLTPDFISYYMYPYIHPEGKNLTETGELIVLLSKDKDIYKKYTDQITQLIKKYFDSKPELYVTEYSSYVSSHNYINDSTFQAAFIIKTTLDNFGSLNALGYWLLSDISIEYEDVADILFGGNGLLTRDGIKKPSYYAFYFLKSLGTSIIEKGDNYIITTTSNRNFQILAYHYSYFNNKYCENQKELELLRYPSSAFEALPPLELTISLSEIPFGTYVVRQHTLDQDHGNILFEWLRMDTPRYLNPQEINYLKHISVPEIKIFKKEVTDSLEVSCHLNINDVVLFEIDLFL